MVPSTSSTSRSDAAAVDWSVDRQAIERRLEALCVEHERVLGPRLAAAVRYALLGGGKRLRGLLFLAGYRSAGGTAGDDAAALAAAIEVVHAYSLVHDDLPCMDDDDIRRGRPTVHRMFAVPVPTVAGVALVPLPAPAAFRGARMLGLTDDAAADIVGRLRRASGAGGMVGGQLLD